MDKKLLLNNKLDFSDIDLTAPDKVVEEILAELPNETNELIKGALKAYSGHIRSYKKIGVSAIAEVLGNREQEVDIQKDLGKIGEENHKYECCLYTPEYDKYQYRLFFIEYGISNYPVTIVFEESIASSMNNPSRGYIYSCKTRTELEDLVTNAITSKRCIEIMQELIRVNQAKREMKTEEGQA